MSAIQGRKYSNRMQAETAKHGQEADMAHRIYYIEDDAGIAEGVAFFLRRKGFEVITAAMVAGGKQLLRGAVQVDKGKVAHAAGDFSDGQGRYQGHCERFSERGG